MQYPAWATQRTPGYYYATPMQQFAPVPFNGASMVSPAAQYLASYTSSVREQGLVPGATPLWQHNTPHSSHSPPTAEEMAHMTPQVAPLAALHPPDIWMPPSLPAVFAGAGCESHFSKLQMMLQDRLAKEESARIYAQHLANERAALLDVEKRSAEAAVLGLAERLNSAESQRLEAERRAASAASRAADSERKLYHQLEQSIELQATAPTPSVRP
eukprot:gene28216-34937_t